MQNETEVAQIAATANLNLDLTQKSYKRIPYDIKNKILMIGINHITAQNNIQYTKEDQGTVIVNMYCANEKTAENILNKLNNWILYNFEEQLELETKEDRTTFFRTNTLFESIINQGTLTLTWSKISE